MTGPWDVLMGGSDLDAQWFTASYSWRTRSTQQKTADKSPPNFCFILVWGKTTCAPKSWNIMTLIRTEPLICPTHVVHKITVACQWGKVCSLLTSNASGAQEYYSFIQSRLWEETHLLTLILIHFKHLQLHTAGKRQSVNVVAQLFVIDSRVTRDCDARVCRTARIESDEVLQCVLW